MSRCALAFACALALVAGGCASGPAAKDHEKARACKKAALSTRLVAGAIAAEMADEAGRLEEARKAGKAAVADASFQRLADGRVLLEAIEEAENAFAFATRYHEVRTDLDLPPRLLARLDDEVDRMAEVAGTIALKRARAFAPAPGQACDPKTAEAIKKDLERDRAVLRALRIDIGLTTALSDVAAAAAE